MGACITLETRNCKAVLLARGPRRGRRGKQVGPQAAGWSGAPGGAGQGAPPGGSASSDSASPASEPTRCGAWGGRPFGLREDWGQLGPSVGTLAACELSCPLPAGWCPRFRPRLPRRVSLGLLPAGKAGTQLRPELAPGDAPVSAGTCAPRAWMHPHAGPSGGTFLGRRPAAVTTAQHTGCPLAGTAWPRGQAPPGPTPACGPRVSVWFGLEGGRLGGAWPD